MWPEPVLAPFLLNQKIPALSGISQVLMSITNFTIIYFFPMWLTFQTVMLTNASIVGSSIDFLVTVFCEHLGWCACQLSGLNILPNSLSMSVGSLFAGWMMYHTGKYKMINLIFGIFPFIGIILITQIHGNSGWVQSWFSIVHTLFCSWSPWYLQLKCIRFLWALGML